MTFGRKDTDKTQKTVVVGLQSDWKCRIGAVFRPWLGSGWGRIGERKMILMIEMETEKTMTTRSWLGCKHSLHTQRTSAKDGPHEEEKEGEEHESQVVIKRNENHREYENGRPSDCGRDQRVIRNWMLMVDWLVKIDCGCAFTQCGTRAEEKIFFLRDNPHFCTTYMEVLTGNQKTEEEGEERHLGVDWTKQKNFSDWTQGCRKKRTTGKEDNGDRIAVKTIERITTLFHGKLYTLCITQTRRVCNNEIIHLRSPCKVLIGSKGCRTGKTSFCHTGEKSWKEKTKINRTNLIMEENIQMYSVIKKDR